MIVFMASGSKVLWTPAGRLRSARGVAYDANSDLPGLPETDSPTGDHPDAQPMTEPSPAALA